ncbi:MAG TPA: co-chaperone DjlA [Steroidobacteraceae bacterium]|jgi:DnaJ like chaperone protein|nr:co-chaperone DjlA [Steroidobacteraceae bacterium]
MSWGGKIIGGAVGMLVGGPVGAAVGALIGHQFDRGQFSANLLGGPAASADPGLVNELFFPSTFRVMGHIAKADGHVSEQEIASARAVMHALHLNAQQVAAAIGYFTEGKQAGFDLDSLLTRLGASLAPYPELAHFFIEIQLQAALAGNGLSAIPRARLQRVATMLGVNAYDFVRLESFLRFRQGPSTSYGPGGPGAGAGGGSHGGNGGAGSARAAGTGERVTQAYSVLEATVTMADEEIVKCYRRQMSRHHPDKLKANGLPESMLERAKERTQQIQAAYELIRERRGMR